MNDTSTTTPTITPKEEQSWTAFFDKYGIKPEHRTEARERLEAHFAPKPRKPRSAATVLKDACSKISDVIRDMRPGQKITVAALMKHVGLDPTNRADAAWIRRFLRESDN
jgi:hypothetical protein